MAHIIKFTLITINYKSMKIITGHRYDEEWFHHTQEKTSAEKILSCLFCFDMKI